MPEHRRAYERRLLSDGDSAPIWLPGGGQRRLGRFRGGGGVCDQHCWASEEPTRVEIVAVDRQLKEFSIRRHPPT
jgi:hypothetical protein